MKRVYVDSSNKKKLITYVIEEEKRPRQKGWDSTERYGRKITSHEAEFFGIINALENVSGDLELCNDDKSLIEMLNGDSKVRQKNKPYIERIKELCQNRTVKFIHIGRDTNLASLKQRGFSFLEMDTPKLKDWRLSFEKEKKAKYKERKRRINRSKKEGGEKTL